MGYIVDNATLSRFTKRLDIPQSRSGAYQFLNYFDVPVWAGNVIVKASIFVPQVGFTEIGSYVVNESFVISAGVLVEDNNEFIRVSPNISADFSATFAVSVHDGKSLYIQLYNNSLTNSANVVLDFEFKEMSGFPVKDTTYTYPIQP